MTIEERVEKLELKLARARFINRLLGVLGIGAFLVMWSFASGTLSAQEEVLDEVRAKSFILVDDTGKTRARLHGVNDVTILELLGVNSNSRVTLALYNEGPRLVMVGKNGRPRAGLGVSSEELLLNLNNKDGKRCISMELTLDEPVINMYNPDGSILWQAP